VDSSVYMTFVLEIFAVIALLLGLFEWAASSAWYGRYSLPVFTFPYAPGADVLFFAAPACFLLAYVIYRLSLGAHA
jgi:hypothetical protein